MARNNRSTILIIDKSAGKPAVTAPTNPYAPPQSFLETPTGGNGCRREGKLLVVPAGASLPERCVKCNAPAIMDKPRSFTWHSSGWYLLILLALLVYVIVGMMVRKKVTLAIGLCEAHRKRRRIGQYSALGVMLFGVAAIFAGAQFDEPPYVALGILALLIAAVVAMSAGRFLSPARIDDVEARFRGCGKAFLDSLPQR